jgi:PBP1b-binding outer membrane lipoprotein LpoB
MKRLILFTVISLLSTGCANTKLGGQSGVSVLDDSSRAHLQAELTIADYTAFAEKVTNKMMASKLFQSWGRKKPKLVVGKLRNNTDNENIRIEDIYDRISETILASGLVRLMDKSATAFDYVVNSDLSSTRQYGSDGEELAYFKLEFKIFKLDGELVGQWSDVLPLGKAKRNFI